MTAADEDDADATSDLVAEIVAHDEDLGAAVADLEDRVAELEDELAEREEEVESLTDRLKRTQADFQNYKKRAKERKEEAEERAVRDVIERFLPVRDDLTRALEDESDDLESLREGVRMTRNEFDRVLDAEGVSRIDPDPGSAVDPTRHEVMMRVESDRPEDTIVDVYRAGYETDDAVLRTAQVTVSEGATDEDGNATAETDAGGDDGDAEGETDGADDEGEADSSDDEGVDDGDDESSADSTATTETED